MQQNAATASERVSVTLAPGQKEALEAIANRNGMTVSFLVRHVITQFLDEREGGQLELGFRSETLK